MWWRPRPRPKARLESAPASSPLNVPSKTKGGKFQLRGAWDITREGCAEDDPPHPRLHQRDPRGESGLQPRCRGPEPSTAMFSSVLSGAMPVRKSRPKGPSRVMRNLMGPSPSQENEARQHGLSRSAAILGRTASRARFTSSVSCRSERTAGQPLSFFIMRTHRRGL